MSAAVAALVGYSLQAFSIPIVLSAYWAARAPQMLLVALYAATLCVLAQIIPSALFFAVRGLTLMGADEGSYARRQAHDLPTSAAGWGASGSAGGSNRLTPATINAFYLFFAFASLEAFRALLCVSLAHAERLFNARAGQSLSASKFGTCFTGLAAGVGYGTMQCVYSAGALINLATSTGASGGAGGLAAGGYDYFACPMMPALQNASFGAMLLLLANIAWTIIALQCWTAYVGPPSAVIASRPPPPPKPRGARRKPTAAATQNTAVAGSAAVVGGSGNSNASAEPMPSPPLQQQQSVSVTAAVAPPRRGGSGSSTTSSGARRRREAMNPTEEAESVEGSAEVGEMREREGGERETEEATSSSNQKDAALQPSPTSEANAEAANTNNGIISGEEENSSSRLLGPIVERRPKPIEQRAVVLLPPPPPASNLAPTQAVLFYAASLVLHFVFRAISLVTFSDAQSGAIASLSPIAPPPAALPSMGSSAMMAAFGGSVGITSFYNSMALSALPFLRHELATEGGDYSFLYSDNNPYFFPYASATTTARASIGGGSCAVVLPVQAVAALFAMLLAAMVAWGDRR